jgi:hypothetical protein
MAPAAEASKTEGLDLAKVVAANLANLHEGLADATEGATVYTDYLCTIPCYGRLSSISLLEPLSVETSETVTHDEYCPKKRGAWL